MEKASNQPHITGQAMQDKLKPESPQQSKKETASMFLVVTAVIHQLILLS
jgi:hypothetical protein